MSNFTRHPEMAEAARVGEPTLVDSKPTSATEVVAEASRALVGGTAAGSGTSAVSVETVQPGSTPPPNQPVPRSDDAHAPATGPAAASNGADTAGAVPSAGGTTPAASTDSNSGGIEDLTTSTDSNNAQGSVQASPSAAKGAASQPANSNDGLTTPAPAPAQINDAGGSGTASAQSANAQGAQASDQGSSSSSKKKKKKHKVIPF